MREVTSPLTIHHPCVKDSLETDGGLWEVGLKFSCEINITSAGHKFQRDFRSSSFLSL